MGVRRGERTAGIAETSAVAVSSPDWGGRGPTVGALERLLLLLGSGGLDASSKTRWRLCYG